MRGDVVTEAYRLLGFSYGPGMAGMAHEFMFDGSLLYVREWPYDLYRAYMASDRGSPEAAEVACRAIDRFLAERGFGPDGERLPSEGGGREEWRP